MTINNRSSLNYYNIKSFSDCQLAGLTRNVLKSVPAGGVNELSPNVFKHVSDKLPIAVLKTLSHEKIKLLSEQTISALAIKDIRQLPGHFIKDLSAPVKEALPNKILRAIAPNITNKTLKSFPASRRNMLARFVDQIQSAKDQSRTESLQPKIVKQILSRSLVAAEKAKAAIDSPQFEAEIQQYKTGSIYLKVMRYAVEKDGSRSKAPPQATSPFQARFSNHAARNPIMISVDPVTGNTVDDVLHVFKYMATGKGPAPKFYESIVNLEKGKQWRRPVQLMHNSLNWHHHTIGKRKAIVRLRSHQAPHQKIRKAQKAYRMHKAQRAQQALFIRRGLHAWENEYAREAHRNDKILKDQKVDNTQPQMTEKMLQALVSEGRLFPEAAVEIGKLQFLGMIDFKSVYWSGLLQLGQETLEIQQLRQQVNTQTQLIKKEITQQAQKPQEIKVKAAQKTNLVQFFENLLSFLIGKKLTRRRRTHENQKTALFLQALLGDLQSKKEKKVPQEKPEQKTNLQPKLTKKQKRALAQQAQQQQAEEETLPKGKQLLLAKEKALRNPSESNITQAQINTQQIQDKIKSQMQQQVKVKSAHHKNENKYPSMNIDKKLDQQTQEKNKERQFNRKKAKQKKQHPQQIISSIQANQPQDEIKQASKKTTQSRVISVPPTGPAIAKKKKKKAQAKPQAKTAMV